MQSVDVNARGHKHVTAVHGSTLELTSDDYLTPGGDCIIGIAADTVPATVSDEVVHACQNAAATIELRLSAGGHSDAVTGRGDPALTFDDGRSLVCRTSDYTDDRTVMVDADAAAADLDRALVASLADGADLAATLRVE